MWCGNRWILGLKELIVYCGSREGGEDLGGNSPSESEHEIWRDTTGNQTVHLVITVLMMPTLIKLTGMVVVWVMNKAMFSREEMVLLTSATHVLLIPSKVNTPLRQSPNGIVHV